MNIAGVDISNPMMWLIGGLTLHVLWSVATDGLFGSPEVWIPTVGMCLSFPMFAAGGTRADPGNLGPAIVVAYITWVFFVVRVINVIRQWWLRKQRSAR